MPAALKNVDWALAHSLYQEGVALKSVAKRTGIPYATLSKRAQRHNWQQLILPPLPAELVKAPAPSHHNQEKANRWKQRMSDIVERYLSRVEDTERTSEDMDLDTLEQLVRITDATDRTARRTFGLDNQSRDDHLTLHLEAEHSAPHQLRESNAVLEVETVPNVDSPPPESAK